VGRGGLEPGFQRGFFAPFPATLVPLGMETANGLPEALVVRSEEEGRESTPARRLLELVELLELGPHLVESVGRVVGRSDRLDQLAGVERIGIPERFELDLDALEHLAGRFAARPGGGEAEGRVQPVGQVGRPGQEGGLSAGSAGEL